MGKFIVIALIVIFFIGYVARILKKLANRWEETRSNPALLLIGSSGPRPGRVVQKNSTNTKQIYMITVTILGPNDEDTNIVITALVDNNQEITTGDKVWISNFEIETHPDDDMYQDFEIRHEYRIWKA